MHLLKVLYLSILIVFLKVFHIEIFIIKLVANYRRRRFRNIKSTSRDHEEESKRDNTSRRKRATRRSFFKIRVIEIQI